MKRQYAVAGTTQIVETPIVREYEKDIRAGRLRDRLRSAWTGCRARQELPSCWAHDVSRSVFTRGYVIADELWLSMVV